MPERLSDSTLMVLELARAEARLLGHDHIGTEHLLLGLLAEGDSGAAAALVGAGARLDAARDKVEEAVGAPAGGRPPVDAALPYTARASRALERASRLSLQRRAEQVEPAHLLQSVLDVEGTAGQVLRGLGVDVVALRDGTTPAAGVSMSRPAPVGSVPPADVQPRCPTCRTPLEGIVAIRELGPAVVVYCRACGSALGVLPG